MIRIESNETIEDLQCSGTRLIQSTSGHRFGEDSVLLANFSASYYVNKNKKYRIFDLGCGCGAISVLLSAKLPASVITGVDISYESAEIFEKNIILNGSEERVTAICCDWNDIGRHVVRGSADIVVSNPPYFDQGSGTHPADADRKAARIIRSGGEEDLARAASYLLKTGGMFFIVCRTIRLTDILLVLRNHDIEPVRLKLVQAYSDSAPKSFLLAARKDGKRGNLITDRPLVIYDRAGVYSEQTTGYYGKTPPMTREKLYEDIITSE